MDNFLNLLLSKSARIIVCEPNGNVRNIMVQVLRNLGFQSIQALGSPKAILDHLEAEGINVDWIISNFSGEDRINFLNLLRFFDSKKEFENIRCSMLLEPDQTYSLLRAFDYGLISFHVNFSTQKEIEDTFKRFFDYIALVNGQEIELALNYLADALLLEKQYEAYLGICVSLVERNPHNAYYFFRLAEAQFHNKKTKEALDSLAQYQLLAPEHVNEVKELKQKFTVSSDSMATPAQALGLERLVVIDPDDQVQKLLWSVAMEIGIPKIDVFEDGLEAWEAVQSMDKIDLVIQEWKIPKLAGYKILQRFRQAGLFELPVIILTGNTELENEPLLREIGVSEIVKKPIDNPTLKQAIIAAMREERFPTQKKIMMRKISQNLAAGKESRAKSLMQKLESAGNLLEPDKHHMKAEFLYFQGKYEKAKDACMEAIKSGGDSLLLLNLLGKCFMRLQDFTSAMKCLNRAQQFSPENIARLCHIAEVEIETGNIRDAKKTIERAENLDKDNQLVKESITKLAVAEGDFKKAKEMVQTLENVTGMISYLNTKAVAHVNNTEYDEAEDIYKKLLLMLPDSHEAERAAILYNLGLAYIRQFEFEKGSAKLREALKYQNPSVEKKASSLNRRLTHAMNSGEGFLLNTDSFEIESEDDDDMDLWESSHSQEQPTNSDSLDSYLNKSPDKPKGCKGHFQKIDVSPELTNLFNKLFKSKIEYKSRGAINRSTGFTGIEKITTNKK